jgi:hypothetical protein
MPSKPGALPRSAESSPRNSLRRSAPLQFTIPVGRRAWVSSQATTHERQSDGAFLQIERSKVDRLAI